MFPHGFERARRLNASAYFCWRQAISPHRNCAWYFISLERLTLNDLGDFGLGLGVLAEFDVRLAANQCLYKDK